MLGADHAGPAGGHHQHVGLAGEGGKIRSAGVGHAHGGICGLKHQRHRLAHQDAAAHHDGPLAGKGHAVAGQQGHHTSGGTAARPRLALEQPAQIQSVQAVGILLRVDRQQQRALIEAGRQGQLQQDAVAGGIGVELLHRGQHFGRTGTNSEVGAEAGDAHSGAGLLLINYVNAAGRVVAHPQHRQTRRATHGCQSLSDRRLQPEFDLTGQLATVHTGGHGAESKHASPACNPPRPRAR